MKILAGVALVILVVLLLHQWRRSWRSDWDDIGDWGDGDNWVCIDDDTEEEP